MLKDWEYWMVQAQECAQHIITQGFVEPNVVRHYRGLCNLAGVHPVRLLDYTQELMAEMEQVA